MTSLALTCKNLKADTEPYLYRTVCTRTNKSLNTAYLVDIFHRRPDLIPHVRVLILDEYHPRYLREIFAIQMQNLLYMVIYQREPQSVILSRRKKRALNRHLVKQPKLKQIDLNGSCPNPIPHLPMEDACLFRHPNLTRLDLTCVRIVDCQDQKKGYFPYENLATLSLESCQYSILSLRRLIVTSPSLTSITLTHLFSERLSFDERDIASALSSATGNLQILKLKWNSRVHVRKLPFPIVCFLFEDCYTVTLL